MEYTIRAITEEDIPSYRRCLDIVARERRFLTFTEAPPLEQSRAFVLRQIACGTLMYIASIDGEVIGWCDISPKWPASHSHRGALGMGVHPDHRGKGVGRRLIEAALAGARAFGLEQVELAVFTTNRPAVNLYRSVGFEGVGRIPRAQKLEDGYAEEMLMVLPLSE